jgi:hypothetical protein
MQNVTCGDDYSVVVNSVSELIFVGKMLALTIVCYSTIVISSWIAKRNVFHERS